MVKQLMLHPVYYDTNQKHFLKITTKDIRNCFLLLLNPKGRTQAAMA